MSTMPAAPEAVCRLAHLAGVAVACRLAGFLAEREAEVVTNGIAVAVVGAGGELIAFGAHTSCPALPRLLAQRKAITALTFRRASEIVAREVAAGSLDLVPFHDDRLLAMAGGVPLNREGRVIGAVGVSGLAAAVDVALAGQFAAILLLAS